MRGGKNVTWIPAYGPEMRGGTANCTVVISDKEIGSPVITTPQTLIVMNNPSLEAFEQRVKSKGILLFNSSLITRRVSRKDIETLAIPANRIASEVGEKRTANMVMLGAYIAKTNVVVGDSILKSLEQFLGKKVGFLEVNRKAFERGLECVGDLAH
jgi:2-oxoglutarate ferredoxin oxidoreductase subunit gamma